MSSSRRFLFVTVCSVMLSTCSLQEAEAWHLEFIESGGWTYASCGQPDEAVQSWGCFDLGHCEASVMCSDGSATAMSDLAITSSGLHLDAGCYASGTGVAAIDVTSFASFLVVRDPGDSYRATVLVNWEAVLFARAHGHFRVAGVERYLQGSASESGINAGCFENGTILGLSCDLISDGELDIGVRLVDGGCGIPPHAEMSYSPTVPRVGEEVFFLSESHDVDGEIVGHDWDFGDGTTAEGKEVTHTYTEAGSYTVSLVVTDDDGLVGETSTTVQVRPGGAVCVGDAQKQVMDFPDTHPIFGPFGKIWEVQAESGERLEVHWWPPLFAHYKLVYFDGSGNSWPVAMCNWPQGCNGAWYWAPDENSNGIPDCIVESLWRSMDFGDDDGEPGYLDVKEHRLKTSTRQYSRTKILYNYSCDPPVSYFPNVCDLRPGCNPPTASVYDVIENDPPLGPEVEAIFDEMELELQAKLADIPTSENYMGRSYIDVCDLNWDGSCDLNDVNAAFASIDLCWPDADYNPLADVDGDGCVTDTDLVLLFGERPITISIDIKPGSCPNPLNSNSQGVLPVALLGTEDFDVSVIDPATVMLEGVSPSKWSYEDVATPFSGELCDCHDLGPDGWTDMTLKFRTQEVMAAIEAMNENRFIASMKAVTGNEADGRTNAVELGPRDYVKLSLTAMTTDHVPITGQDCVHVTWKGNEGQDGADASGSEGQITEVNLFVSNPSSLTSGAQITFGLPEPTHVTVSIYDVAGRKVKTLASEFKPGGIHTLRWDGRDEAGIRVAGGVYFCRVTAPGFDKAVKLMIVK